MKNWLLLILLLPCFVWGATDSLYPDADPANDNWTLTGGGTKHGGLSDNSDATYITGVTSGDDENIGMTAHSVPAGSTVDSVHVNVRASAGVNNNCQLFLWWDSHNAYCIGGSIDLAPVPKHTETWKFPLGQVSGGSACNEAWTVAKLDSGLEVEFIAAGAGTARNIYEAWITIYYTAAAGGQTVGRRRRLIGESGEPANVQYAEFNAQGYYEFLGLEQTYVVYGWKEPKDNWLWSIN